MFSLADITLMEWEECRLKAYIDAMREVRVGPGHNRGSVNDLIRLAARSTRHRSVRGHLISTIRDDEVIQARFITLVCPQRLKSSLE